MLTGVLAMAKHQVVIRDLNAVESLGRVSVVCSDKTGTITKNEMTVKWVCIPALNPGDLLYGVTGVGFQPDGKIIEVNINPSLEEIVKTEPETLGGVEVKIEPETPLETLIVSGMLNNDSTVVEDKVKTADKKIEKTIYKAIGDATDASILILFYKSKLDESVYKSRYQEVRSYPFDSKLKRMTRVFKDNKTGKYVVFTKGATEVLLPRCSRIVKDRIDGVEPLTDDGRSQSNFYFRKRKSYSSTN